MTNEIEISLDHIQEDLSVTVEFDYSFHRDSHGAPYGYEEWIEYEINRQVFMSGFDIVPVPTEFKKEIEKEIDKQVLASANDSRWKIA